MQEASVFTGVFLWLKITPTDIFVYSDVNVLQESLLDGV
jgi:hypothetical protein